MEMITQINGNGQPYTLPLPKILMIGYCNPTALKHIEENTGLKFVETGFGVKDAYTAQPENSGQIAALIMTYNFKTRYYNNADWHNTLMLKSDHHIGFDVDSICVDCCKHNYINVRGLSGDDRLSC